jgi:aspartokinase
MLLSAGERISMSLLSLAIRELGGDAISFTGSQSGIITNDRHVDAGGQRERPGEQRGGQRTRRCAHRTLQGCVGRPQSYGRQRPAPA